jgi:signal transduction histidine kinase
MNIKKQVTDITLDSIVETTNAIAGFPKLNDVFDLILNKLVDLMGLRLPSIYLKDSEQGMIYLNGFIFPKTFVKMAEKLLKQDVYKIGYSLDDDKNILVKAVKTREIQITSDMVDFVYPLLNKSFAHSMQGILNLKTMLAIPLIVRDDAIGVLAVASKHELLDDDQLRLIRIFANQISIAVYNARLFEQTQRQIKELNAKTQDLQALFQTSQIASRTLEFDNVVQKIMDQFPESLKHLGVIGGVLTIIDWDRRVNRGYAMTNTQLSQRAIQLLNKPFTNIESELSDKAKNLTQRAIFEKKSFVTDSLSSLTLEALPKPMASSIQKLIGMRSGVVAPVVVRDKVIGTIMYLLNRPQEDVDDREIEIFQSVASQIGFSMENARLYEHEHERAEKLRQLNKKLLHLDQMKSEFISIASHQLRTPLSGIKGYLSMLDTGDFGELNPNQAEIVSVISENTSRLISLVADFLNVSRIESGRLKVNMESVQINDALRKLVRDFQPIAQKKGLAISYAENDQLPKAYVDRDKISEVFSNLIDNAIKYTKKGGLTITTEVDDSHITVVFADTGIGITIEELENIFEKFSRGKESNKMYTRGLGIGLYVVKNLLKVQGGEVTVKSPGRDQGTTFYVVLRRAQEE